MKLNDFLELVSACPTCNSRMSHGIIELRNRHRKLVILDCSCYHYESYEFEADSQSNPEIVLTAFSIHLVDFSTSWFDEKKELIFRESDGTIVAKIRVPGKNILDWIFNPYKNIIDKINNVILLK